MSHGGSRLFQFDRTGKFVREIGQGAYGMLQAQQVRVDPQDNVWIVDQMSTQVIKFDPNGRVQMLLSRKPEAMRVPTLPLTPRRREFRSCRRLAPPAAGPVAAAAAGRRCRCRCPVAAAPAVRRLAAARCGGGVAAALPGAGAAGESFQRPTDVAWDKAGNIYVADGYGNARVAKYEPSGKYIKSWGSAGTGPGQFNIVHGIAIDAQGNVYVADEGNRRIQVFDAERHVQEAIRRTSERQPQSASRRGRARSCMCAHTGDPDGMEDAAIYKLDLDGNIRRQVRQGGQGAEAIRAGQLHRLPHRERAARRRADELARAEADTEAGTIGV